MINGPYSTSNRTLSVTMRKDRFLSSLPIVEKILLRIPVLIYVGQMDMLDGPFGTQKWMEDLTWPSIDEFNAQDRRLYYYESDDANEIRMGGYYKQFGNLKFLIVHAAGHLLPATQLALSRSMVKDMHDVK